MEHNYIELSSQLDQNYEMNNNDNNNNNGNHNQQKNGKHVHFQLPTMRPMNANSELNGLMTHNQGKIITQTMQQTNDNISDINVFEQFANTNTSAFNNITSQINQRNNSNNNNNNNANPNNEFSVFNCNYYNYDGVYDSDSPDEKFNDENKNNNNNNNNDNNKEKDVGNQMSMQLIRDHDIKFIGQQKLYQLVMIQLH